MGRMLPKDLLKFKQKGDRTEQWMKYEKKEAPTQQLGGLSSALGWMRRDPRVNPFRIQNTGV